MPELQVDLRDTARSIASVQRPDGCIPWARGRHADPWNHIEAAMGLDAAGLHGHAEAAYAWLARTQSGDGSWPSATLDGRVMDATIDTNFCAYVAAGCWHHFLATSDERFLRKMWPVVEAAIDFVLDLQLSSGAVAWARDPSYEPWPQALLASSSSIHHSLRCAVSMAEWLGGSRPDWELSLTELEDAVREPGSDFLSKPLYSMDWYYPVLGGAFDGGDARSRLDEGWETFVVEGRGVLCTSDRPWVTTGETAELVLTCDAVGLNDRAALLFEWMQHLRDDDGMYWTGINHPDGSRYPLEKTTWSAGAVLLAADALTDTTPTSGFFRHVAGTGSQLAQDPEAPVRADLLEVTRPQGS
jgi:hypothetical protein